MIQHTELCPVTPWARFCDRDTRDLVRPVIGAAKDLGERFVGEATRIEARAFYSSNSLLLANPEHVRSRRDRDTGMSRPSRCAYEERHEGDSWRDDDRVTCLTWLSQRRPKRSVNGFSSRALVAVGR